MVCYLLITGLARSDFLFMSDINFNACLICKSAIHYLVFNFKVAMSLRNMSESITGKYLIYFMFEFRA